MSRVLSIQSRQRIRSINIPLLRRITRRLLTAHLAVTSYELGLHLVDTAEMTRVNEQFLQHRGSTDVITFDHNPAEELPSSPPRALHGELFLSIHDAVTQARAR